MKDKATIEIDCDAGIVTVSEDSGVDPRKTGDRKAGTTKASLIAQFLAPQYRYRWE